MRGPRPSRVVQLVREGIPLAMPAILLVTGGFLLGFDTHAAGMRNQTEDLVTTVDPKITEKDQYPESSLIKVALFNHRVAKSPIGSSIEIRIRA